MLEGAQAHVNHMSAIVRRVVHGTDNARGVGLGLAVGGDVFKDLEGHDLAAVPQHARDAHAVVCVCADDAGAFGSVAGNVRATSVRVDLDQSEVPSDVIINEAVVVIVNAVVGDLS